MEFEPTSRYADVETAELTLTDDEGRPRVVAYTRRRMIPDLTGQPVLAEVRVTEGDRLDVMTARHLGDPTQFWRLCDANIVLQPTELEAVGRVVRIVIDQA